MGKTFMRVSTGKATQGRVNTLGLNSSGRCWGVEAIPGCLELGPGLIWGTGNIGLVCESYRERVVGNVDSGLVGGFQI